MTISRKISDSIVTKNDSRQKIVLSIFNVLQVAFPTKILDKPTVHFALWLQLPNLGLIGPQKIQFGAFDRIEWAVIAASGTQYRRGRDKGPI